MQSDKDIYTEFALEKGMFLFVFFMFTTPNPYGYFSSRNNCYHRRQGRIISALLTSFKPNFNLCSRSFYTSQNKGFIWLSSQLTTIDVCLLRGHIASVRFSSDLQQ